MSSRFILVVAYCRIPFFFKASLYSIACICHIFFSHSSIGRYFGYFHILDILNNAAMNMGCRYLFELVFSFSLDKCPGVELLYQMVVLFSIFCKTSILSSTVVEFIFPPIVYKCSFFSTSLPVVVISWLFEKNSHSKGCEVIARGFDLHFPSG